MEADLRDGSTLFTTPAPTSGNLLAFMTNILDGYQSLDYSALTFHRLIETFKFAYAKRTELGDPDFVDVADLLDNLNDPEFAAEIRGLIDDTQTFNSTEHYGANYSVQGDGGTAHSSIVAPNGDVISMTGTINYV